MQFFLRTDSRPCRRRRGWALSGSPPPHLLVNYVHPWGPSAKHSSIPACLHANRARVLLPFRVMKVSTSAICVRGQILGDIPGRGSQRVHHRRYRRHDVRRSNFSAARRRRNSPRRPINDHRTFGRSSTINADRRLGLNCQTALKTAQGLRLVKSSNICESRIFHLFDAARCTSDSPADAACSPK